MKTMLILYTFAFHIFALTSSARRLSGVGRVVPQQDLLALVGSCLCRSLLLPVLHDVRERELLVRVEGLKNIFKLVNNN